MKEDSKENKRNVSSWGNIKQCTPLNHVYLNDEKLSSQITSTKPGITYGMGRSYGDVCLSGDSLWHTSNLNRFIAFDETTGLLTCQAGVLIGEIQNIFYPRNWQLPVTPGTQFVTIAGAVANDVHGKNHHQLGSIGYHIKALTLLRTDGSTIKCSDSENANWLYATIGGLGLTGIILDVTIQLIKTPGPYLQTETICFSGIDEFIALSEQSKTNWAYTVSWVDCLASNKRGLFIRANHTPEKRKQDVSTKTWSIPFHLPFSLVNSVTLKAFNTLYYHYHKRKANTHLSHYRSFFYPLDKINHWNRLYGRRGFYQYQAVIPYTVASDAINDMLNVIAKTRQGSFLCVLKVFGASKSLGLLSFPMPGITLALDFPNRSDDTLKLLERLDAIVLESGGRLYPAKDARMSAKLFRAGYPKLDEFLKFCDPNISSLFAKRVIEGLRHG